MSKTAIVIPARYKSSRFPGKPLAKILGKEMIFYVGKICEKTIGKKNVHIATDDIRIQKKCESFGFNTLITPNCSTGTDRVFLASKKIKANIIINVQGDEPLIKISDIKKIIEAKKKYPNHVICGYTYIKYTEAKSLHVPKLVINKNNELIYMSRSVIPGSKQKN